MTGRKIGKFGLGALIASVMLLGAQPALAGPEHRAMAKRIHDRLTGVNATNDVIDHMETLLLSDPSGKSAADYVIDTDYAIPAEQNPNARYFYNVTLKNFVTPWTNEAQTVFAPLNDYTATAVGLIRDGADFRRILYDDVVYRGAGGLGLRPYDSQGNDHYEDLEALGPIAGDLSDDTILIEDAQSVLYTAASNPNPIANFDANAAAGVMTSRAGAMAFYSAGTNRAMFRFTLMNHLCTDLEPLKDVTRTPDRVRRDVSRSPGGDSRIFLNACVGCHAGMDGMAGAFAYYEWNYDGVDINTGILEYTPGVVSEKHNINPNNFADGYVTIDDSWINYWRNGPNAKLGNRPGDNSSGWAHGGEVLDDRGNAVGNGARSLGIELANSKAFAQCQVDKVFEAVCLRDPNLHSTDRAARDVMVNNFKAADADPYNLRDVFTDVAAYCKEAQL